jgi:hypothetical protein
MMNLPPVAGPGDERQPGVADAAEAVGLVGGGTAVLCLRVHRSV